MSIKRKPRVVIISPPISVWVSTLVVLMVVGLGLVIYVSIGENLLALLS